MKRAPEFGENGNSKKKKRLSTDFYVRLKTWLLQHYEAKLGSFTFKKDIFEHLMNDKENLQMLETDVVTKNIITRVVNELCASGDGIVYSAKKNVPGVARTSGKRASRDWGFFNLRRRNANDEEPISLSDLGKENGWEALYNADGVSFVRILPFSFDGQRAIAEIAFRVFDYSQPAQDIVIKYNRHEINLEEFPGIKSQIEDNILGEQAKFLLLYLNKTSFCSGFAVKNNDIPNLKYSLFKDLNNSDNGAEYRVFSDSCQVFSNSSGISCDNCQKKNYLCRKKEKRNIINNGATNNRCNHRYMTKDQLIKKVKIEKRQLLAEKRRKEKIEEELLELEGNDQCDLADMFQAVDKKNVPEEMDILWEQQRKILQTSSSRGYRWHPRVMRLCIELYSKNPHVLDPLRKVMYLPSNRTIRYYKNKTEQKPGWNREMLQWCLREAKEKNLKDQDYWGGLILDEMKIQENIEMVVKNGKHRLVGFVDLGEIHDDMETLAGASSSEPKLSTHVLQFIFVSDHGFRFPVAQFPSGGCSSSDLFFIFWEGVKMMHETGFHIYWCILDGAEVNRSFIKIHFKNEEEAVAKKFVAQNIHNGEAMVFLMDPKHNFKKIRNNILKSSCEDTTATRCLKVKGKSILWEQFINAFNFDQGEFSLSLHHLAEEVLDKDMLRLMKTYKKHLQSKGQDGSMVDSTIELLTYTSKVISLFHDRLTIQSLLDTRLKVLQDFLVFLTQWKAESDVTSKNFISYKLWFDLQSMILGFQEIICVKLKSFPQSVIKPAIINQDVVENHFCQVRSCNGQNNNPTYRLQEISQNAIRFGQTTISRKSNAGLNGLKKRAT